MRASFIVINLMFCFSTLAFNDTPNYWKCSNRTGGEWKFGRAPSACDVDAFIEPDYVQSELGPIIFDDSQYLDDERRRYMSSLFGVIKEAAKHYITARKPDVGLDEIENFQEAVYAVAHQESFWSHYRKNTSGRLQMMRGDYGHGHGIFQVDDRWHYSAILNGSGGNIIKNAFYALEAYYDQWKRAPSASCAREGDWESIARSAYSAYNGGSSRICRWTNPGDKWARNDQGFKAKYDGKSWEGYVDDLEIESFVSVDCVFNEQTGCKDDLGQVQEPKEGYLYRSDTYGFCVYSQGKFICSDRDEQCLYNSFYPNASSVKNARLYSQWEQEYSFESGPKNACKDVVGLFTVGEPIKVLKNINVRKTPGGERIGTIESGKTTQALYRVVSDAISLDRYYLISFNGSVGFIYAGDESDYDQWAVRSREFFNYQTIPVVGDRVKASDDYLSVSDKNISVSSGETYKVTGVYIEDGQKLYLDLEIEGQSFEFFAGNVNPFNFKDYFVLQDTKALEKPMIRLARLSKRIWYKSMKKCPAKSCLHAGYLRGPRLTSRKIKVYESANGWLKVQQYSRVGWIQQKYLKVY